LEFVEPPDAQKTFTQDEETPSVADDSDRAGHRTGLFLKFIPFHQLLQ
jgi:hypothetical protein